MADLGDFDAEQVEPSRGFGLMPKGWVEAMIVESPGKDTVVDGFTKRRVTMVYQILDQRQEYKNRKHWHGLNLKNPNAQTVQIANGQLSSICRAVGIQKPGDSTALHNIPHMILIGQRKNSESGELENVINDWKPKGGVSAVMSAGAAGHLSQAQAPTMGVPAKSTTAPWPMKKAQ